MQCVHASSIQVMQLKWYTIIDTSVIEVSINGRQPLQYLMYDNIGYDIYIYVMGFFSIIKHLQVLC